MSLPDIWNYPIHTRNCVIAIVEHKADGEKVSSTKCSFGDVYDDITIYCEVLLILFHPVRLTLF